VSLALPAYRRLSHPAAAACCPSFAGDVNSVSIGDRTNVQDNVLVHVAKHNMAGKVRLACTGWCSGAAQSGEGIRR
jgi:hypothetical protein